MPGLARKLSVAALRVTPVLSLMRLVRLTDVVLPFPLLSSVRVAPALAFMTVWALASVTSRPTVFVPEYHPDGTVRLAVMPPRRTITTQVRNRPKEP